MDNNSTNKDPNTTAPLITPTGTAGAAGPKVFDLSSINSANTGSSESFFKKKPFIIGVLSVLVLIGAIAAGTYVSFFQNKATNPNKTNAADCLVVNSTNLNQQGDTARVRVNITNNCQDPMDVQFEQETHWCSNMPVNQQGGHFCQDNGVGTWTDKRYVLQPGKSTPDFEVSQKVGNTGTCGSAQVDVFYKTPSGSKVGPYFGVAWLDNECSSLTPTPTPTTLKCLALHIVPETTTVTAGQQIRLQVDRTGGTGSYVTTLWDVQTSPATGAKGTFSRPTGDSTYWTAPTPLTDSQTWTFTGTVKDDSGATDSSGCVRTVSFGSTITTTPTPTPTATPTPSGTPTPTPTPTASCNKGCSSNSDCDAGLICSGGSCRNPSCTDQSDCGCDVSHKTCQNNACVSVSGSGSDSCTSDASCQPSATPPPIPESGNTALTIGAIVAGAVAIMSGIFLAL